MNIKYKNTENKHLKVVSQSIREIVSELSNKLINKNGDINILNIGGGYEKEVEKYLSSKKNINYYCLDIETKRLKGNYICGDITDKNLNINIKFDIIYTSNTFEHILNPWDATENILNLLKEGSYIICIVPFSWRYHACPVDTYRYTHTGIRYLFERKNFIECIFSGYHIQEGSVSSWYKSGTDKTLSGKPFKENIQTVYIGKKNSKITFDISDLDIDKNDH